MNTSKLNLFASVLTYPAPSSNYRGESEENRTVIQRIHKNDAEYAVISPESMRNALREILAKKGFPCNRSRLHSEDQLAVEFKDFPDASKYADDFLFGYMVADPKVAKQMKGRPAKRDSVLRMNMAVALTSYQHDATFHQSPQNAGASPWKNSAWAPSRPPSGRTNPRTERATASVSRASTRMKTSGRPPTPSGATNCLWSPK